ncbi:MAG: nitroreductase [Bacilli bacterium]|nr:nitroreductase [Bacilli bacterium]
MAILDTISERRSVRTFDKKWLSEEHAKAILSYAEKAKNPYNLPISWKLLNADEHGLSSPVIVGTNLWIAGKLERLPHAEEAFGYSFEQVVLYAKSIGVGTTWIAGTMNRGAFEKAMGLSENEVLPCVSPLGYPAAKMSIRETLMRKGVKGDSRFPFDEIFFDNDFSTPLSEEKTGKLKDAFEAVRLAPSAVNKQPWRVVLSGNRVHFYEWHSKGFLEGDWDIQKIDMGIAICHFEAILIERGINASFEIADPGLSTPSNVSYIASFVLE